MRPHPPKPLLKTDSTKTLQETVYYFIKTRVMNRDLKPGQSLTDNNIAKELNMSRTPVREALHRLEHEGLLTRQIRGGWKVYSLSIEDINEIFDIKVTLEGMMARRGAECKDIAKRTALKKALKRMKQAASIKDYEAWRHADIELHHLIFAMYGNERASRIIDDLNNQWYRVRIGLAALEGRLERSNREHEEIVASILAGNGNEAERLTIKHLNKVRDDLIHVLVNLVLPFAESGV